jgi:hypothetical protein
MVEHEDEVHLWFKEALVNPALLTAWHAYMAKKQKCDQVEDLLSKKALDSVSTEPVYLRWGLSKPHLLAIDNDTYVAKARRKGVTTGPALYGEYPPRAKKNGHNVPYLASLMQGVELNHKDALIAGTRDPPLDVQTVLTNALEMAFDNLPESEKPENKAKFGLFDDFGQHKLNLDNSSHNYTNCNAYERLYLITIPEKSERASSKVRVATDDGRLPNARYEDEVSAPPR